MPRRRVLTEAQLENLLALPTTEADLVRHWTLDRADLAAVDRSSRSGREPIPIMNQNASPFGSHKKHPSPGFMLL
jgi:hypothetical protein